MLPLTSFLIVAAAVVLVYLESVFDGFRNLLGTQANLLPGLMVYAALSHGLPTVTTLAVVGGLSFDTLSANPLGISVLPLFLCGLAVHSYRTLILRDQLFAQVMLGLAASAVCPLLTLLMLLNMDRSPLVSWASVWQWIIVSIVGAAVTPWWFRLFDRVSLAINYRPTGDTAFRSDRQIKRGRQYRT